MTRPHAVLFRVMKHRQYRSEGVWDKWIIGCFSLSILNPSCQPQKNKHIINCVLFFLKFLTCYNLFPVHLILHWYCSVACLKSFNSLVLRSLFCFFCFFFKCWYVQVDLTVLFFSLAPMRHSLKDSVEMQTSANNSCLTCSIIKSLNEVSQKSYLK